MIIKLLVCGICIRLRRERPFRTADSLDGESDMRHHCIHDHDTEVSEVEYANAQDQRA